VIPLPLFCELGLKLLGPLAVQWQLLHVEKDDQVIRHNNNKTWKVGRQKRKNPESILVQNISEKLFRCTGKFEKKLFLEKK
jgi:hypothetical protein